MTIEFDNKARKILASEIDDNDLIYDGTPIKDIVIKPVSIKIARKYIASFHYTHTMPDSTRFAFAGYLNNKLCGVICYGMGCGKNQYTALIPDIENGQYLELTRLWCAESYPRNTESKIISGSLHLLPKEIKLVISFADSSMNHVGTIYKATNWYYCGMSNAGKVLIDESGLQKHVRLLGIYRARHSEYKNYSNKELLDLLGYKMVEGGAKHRYVMLRGSKKERRQMYNKIKDKILPYPTFIEKNDIVSDREMLERGLNNGKR